MHSLLQSSRARHENTNVSFGTHNASGRVVLRPLSTALDLLPTSYNSLQATLAHVDELAHRAANLSYVCDGPISSTYLSTRTYNALLKSRITTIGQFCAMELHDLKWLRNFGKKAMAEAAAYRAHLGASLQLEA